MARVTVERSLDKVDSRFELVVLSAYRAHAIYCGNQTLVNRNDKYAILALREIEEGRIKIEDLKDVVLKKYALETQTSMTSHSFVANDFSFDDLVDNGTRVDLEENDEDENKVVLGVGSDFFSSSSDEKSE
jgi:DNA-directed RNA polymerase subunit omega